MSDPLDLDAIEAAMQRREQGDDWLGPPDDELIGHIPDLIARIRELEADNAELRDA